MDTSLERERQLRDWGQRLAGLLTQTNQAILQRDLERAEQFGRVCGDLAEELGTMLTAAQRDGQLCPVPTALRHQLRTACDEATDGLSHLVRWLDDLMAHGAVEEREGHATPAV